MVSWILPPPPPDKQTAHTNVNLQLYQFSTSYTLGFRSLASLDEHSSSVDEHTSK
jgi:hypothetical protein